MKLLLTMLLFVFTTTKTIAQKPNDILGHYWTPKKDGKVEIFKMNNCYFGKFIWGIKPRIDHKNPNKALQSRSLLGVVFLSDFIFQDGKYTGGKVYDPGNGKTYNCEITIAANKDLKVRGFIGSPLFGRTEIFEKIK